MKRKFLLCTALLGFASTLAQAGTVSLVVGTPGNDNLATPTLFSPNLGGLLLNFANLNTGLSCEEGVTTDCPTFNPSTYAGSGVTISSPNGLLEYPYSTQGPASNPVELFDEGAGGTADTTIGLNFATTAIGVGISDSDDPVEVQLEALGLGGADLGTFDVSTDVVNAESAQNYANTYFVVEDTTAEIYGLEITQTDSSVNNSGLAISDVQVVTPEPSCFLLLGGGMALIGGFSRRRKKA